MCVFFLSLILLDTHSPFLRRIPSTPCLHYIRGALPIAACAYSMSMYNAQLSHNGSTSIDSTKVHCTAAGESKNSKRWNARNNFPFFSLIYFFILIYAMRYLLIHLMRGACTTDIAEMANNEKRKLFAIHFVRAHAQYFYSLFYRQPVSQYMQTFNRRHVGTWTNLFVPFRLFAGENFRRINCKWIFLIFVFIYCFWNFNALCGPISVHGDMVFTLEINEIIHSISLMTDRANKCNKIKFENYFRPNNNK